MQSAPRITFVDLEQSPAIEANILRKIEKLEQFYPMLTSCDVMLRMELKNSNQAKLFRPRIVLNVPGDKININHSANEDVYVAIRDAFNAAIRSVRNYAQKQRGDVKQHAVQIQGRIARLYLDEGFGFIESGDDEFYFEEFNLHDCDFDRLREGMQVTFIPSDADLGLQAKRVHLKKREMNHQ